MSRTDKRAGRVKYITGRDTMFLVLQKALFGKDWKDNNAIALFEWYLCSISNELSFNNELWGSILEPKQTTKTLMVGALKTLRLSATIMVAKGDGDGLQKLGRLINCVRKRHCDQEAVEICCAYLKFLIINKAFPSGKELSREMDDERTRRGIVVSPKTHDAIRERALRLGLKLKGKRAKNK